MAGGRKMNKKINNRLLAGIIVLAFVIILFIPFGYTSYDDGGTVRFTSLTYTVVEWNRYESDWSSGEMEIELYQNTSFYLFPHNFKSLDELWKIRH